MTKKERENMRELSLDEYSKQTNNIEKALDEADRFAEECNVRMSHDEVFGGLRRRIM